MLYEVWKRSCSVGTKMRATGGSFVPFCLRRGKMLRIGVFLIVLLLCPCSVLAQMVPSTEAEAVSGQKISFPPALHGRGAVLVTSFSRQAGSLSDAWVSALASDPALAGVPVYRAVMLEAAPGFVRSRIKSSLRHAISPSQQPFCLVFVRDEKLWRRALAPTDDKLPVVVLLAPDGKIRWRGQGTVAEQLPHLNVLLRP